MPSTFLGLPTEIRVAIYRAYIGTWSSSLSDGRSPTNLDASTANGVQLRLGYPINLLLVCRQIWQEINDFDCVRSCYSGRLICPKHVSWLSYEYVRYHWIFRRTTTLVHTHLGILLTQKWNVVSVLPALQRIVIENAGDWSASLSLESGVHDAAAMLQSKDLPSHVLCRQDDFRTLETICLINDIRIVLHTILKIKDRCNINALPIKAEVLVEPNCKPRLISYIFPTENQKSGFFDAVAYHRSHDEVRQGSFLRKCCCSFWCTAEDMCPYAYHSHSSAANLIYMPSDMAAAMEAFRYE